MDSKPKRVSTPMGCLILLAIVLGIIVVGWFGSTVNDLANRPTPEQVRRQTAIEVCSEKLVAEHMPGLKGVEGRKSTAEKIATVAQQGDSYTVSWGIGDAWCQVNLVTTAAGIRSSNPKVSWK